VIAEIVYALCGITSALCAVLLWRAYRKRKVRLLLWAAICFAFLGAQNVLLFLDIVVLPVAVNLSVLRGIVGAIGVGSLLYGILSDGA
jgi:hypothetical protein